MPDGAPAPDRGGTTDRTRTGTDVELDGFRVPHVTLPGIEDRTGLRFPDVLRAADGLVVPEARAVREPPDGLGETRW